MGFLGVKTYRKRLTGAVRSFLSYSEVISGRFGEKQFFDFFRPCFGPISNHIGPNLTLSGTKSPNLCMYMSCCLIWHHHRLWRTSLPTTHIPIHIWHLFLDTWYLWTRYPCVSVDQIFMGVCRPDIYGYLVTRYLWVSVIFFFSPEGKAVGNLLIAIPVLLFFSK